MPLPTIGVTPIGTEAWDWYRETVMSQYANSPKLMAWIQSIYEGIDVSGIIDDFYSNVFNLDTCSTYGLDLWARIVVIDRNLKSSGQFFGFTHGLDYPDPWIEPFNAHGPFYRGVWDTTTFQVEDDIFRRMILAKGLANISEGTIPALNRILQILFPLRGNCYVADNEDMTMTYTFEFVITPVEYAVLTQTAIFQKPAGVTRLFSFV